MAKLHTVSGDIGVFKQGQELTTPTQLVEYLRRVYQEGQDPTDMSDADILAIAESIPHETGDDADEAWEISVMEAIETGNVPGAGPSYDIADDIRSVAAKVAADKGIQKWVDDIITGQNKVDSGPVFMYELIAKDLTPAERGILPWPGSTLEDGSNNPDVYPIRKQKANGDWTNAKGYKVRDFISLQPRIVALDSQLEKIVAAPGAKLTTADVDTRKILNAEKASAVRAYTRAIKVMHIADKLLDHKHIGFEVKKDDKGNTVESKYCLNILNNHKRLDGGSVSVSAFIKLNYITPDMTYPQLTAAMKRSKKKGTTPNALKFDAPSLPDGINAIVNALETPGTWSVFVSTLEKAIKEGGDVGKGARELASSILDAEELLMNVLDHKGGSIRIAAMAQRDADKLAGNDAKSNAA